jgi:hypothetical protein
VLRTHNAEEEANMTTETAKFLNRAVAFNEFNAVRLSAEADLPLVHPFWSTEQISKALPIRDEWDVPEHLIPFYGDWHTLFCVDSSTASPSVIMLGDSRVIVHRWESFSAFSASLHTLPEERSNHLGIIESKSWLKF